MKKILFICHGNICRSPMAEYVMKHLVHQNHLDHEYEIASAATSTEEIGNPVYPPAQRKLAEHGITCKGHHARQVTKADYNYYDELIIMDHNNYRNLMRIIGSDPLNKVRMLIERDVADPWYTGDFDATYRDVVKGCEAIISSE